MCASGHVQTAELHESYRSDMDCDDTPPPLSSLADQRHAVQLIDTISGTVGLQDKELQTAAITQSTDNMGATASTGASKTGSRPAATKLLKKGFFDRRAENSSARVVATKGLDHQIPYIKAQQPRQQQSIPDFLKVPPDEQQQRLTAMKSQLLSALQPTPDTVSTVSQDPTLMAGFDDPEVMAAVAEVARDPKAFKKYAQNQKNPNLSIDDVSQVQKFYQAMGGLVGSKLEKMGA